MANKSSLLNGQTGTYLGFHWMAFARLVPVLYVLEVMNTWGNYLTLRYLPGLPLICGKRFESNLWVLMPFALNGMMATILESTLGNAFG